MPSSDDLISLSNLTIITIIKINKKENNIKSVGFFSMGFSGSKFDYSNIQ